MPEHKPENSDQSPSEQRPKAERETSIAKRKEQLEKRFILLSRVIQPEPARAFNSWYTRIENPLGASTVTNTPSASRQLMFTLAMCDHPAVDDLLAKIERGEITEENFNPDSLAKAEVERGMKILDLGCGPAPTFARTARRLGANVYTVDVIPASEFRLWRPKEGGADYLKQVEVTSPDEYNKMILLSDEYETTRREEADRHIEIDLNDRDADATILQRTGGGFDLVTSAQLLDIGYKRRVHEPDEARLSGLAMKLLKSGGVFYCPSRGERSIEIKSEQTSKIDHRSRE